MTEPKVMGYIVTPGMEDYLEEIRKFYGMDTLQDALEVAVHETYKIMKLRLEGNRILAKNGFFRSAVFVP